MSGVSLNVGLAEKPLYQVVKLKPKILEMTEGYMSRRSANREWTTAQEKEVHCRPKEKKILKGVKRPESEVNLE